MKDWARAHPLAVDTALAVALVVLGCWSLVLLGDESVFGPDAADFPRPGSYLLVAATMGPLALRRRWPVAVLLVAVAAFSAGRLLDIPEDAYSTVGLFFAIHAAGAYGGRLRTAARGLAIVVLFGVLLWILFRSEAAAIPTVFRLQLFLIVINAFYFAAAWVLGDVSRTRRQREVQLRDWADELDRTRAENARRAVVDERVRIARELHDVVAHHVSVMGVQAGAARRVLGTRPEAAESALATIEASSRQAVAELQNMLRLLRAEGQEDTLAPAPTLRGLGALVAEFERDAGLHVVLVTEGEARPVPPGIDLSAYRIVQEALTNTLKHAGPAARAEVTVRYERGALEIEVVDDGRGPGPSENGHGGHGLIGMRERAALHGGQIELGSRRGGGFRVRARFPTGAP